MDQHALARDAARQLQADPSPRGTAALEKRILLRTGGKRPWCPIQHPLQQLRIMVRHAIPDGTDAPSSRCRLQRACVDDEEGSAEAPDCERSRTADGGSARPTGTGDFVRSTEDLDRHEVPPCKARGPTLQGFPPPHRHRHAAHGT